MNAPHLALGPATSALDAALRRRWERTDPLCIEYESLSEPKACLRSSNSRYHVPLKFEDAVELARAIKRLARLDSSEPAKSQVGAMTYRDLEIDVTCCPQLRGEILLLRTR